MTASFAQHAIAMLIDLAERGEINPWDVQVIDVIDRFLSELKPVETQAFDRAAYEAELSRSGQAFLYASMLVLLKADSLARLETDEAEAPAEVEEFFEDFSPVGGNPLPLNLERQIRRRAVARPPQQRRVTLPELIEQLELIAVTLESRPPRPRTRRTPKQSRSQTVRAITQLAHQENLTEVAIALETLLRDQGDALHSEREWLDFDHLLTLWADCGHELAKPSDRVGVFWALLLLSAQSKVELLQDDFYQDLKIRVLEPAVQVTPSTYGQVGAG